LPKVVTQHCLEWDWNPRPTDRKSKTLPLHYCATLPCVGDVCDESASLSGPVHSVQLALRASSRGRTHGHRRSSRSHRVAGVRHRGSVLLPAARRRRLLLLPVPAEQPGARRHLPAHDVAKPRTERRDETVREVSACTGWYVLRPSRADPGFETGGGVRQEIWGTKVPLKFPRNR